MNNMNLIEKWSEFLRNYTHYSQVENKAVITTPFLDIHNNYIKVYLEEREDGRLTLKDEGETLFLISGMLNKNISIFEENTFAKSKIIKIVYAFDVTMDDEKIYDIVDKENFPEGLKNFIQCILAVQYAIYYQDLTL